MKRYFLLLIVILFNLISTFAQFSSSKEYYIWYRYDFDLVDGIKMPVERNVGEYLFFWVHNGKVWWIPYSSLKSDISTEKAKQIVGNLIRTQSQPFCYDSSVSDYNQTAYGYSGYYFFFNKDNSKLVRTAPDGTIMYYTQVDIEKEKSQKLNKRPKHFFDE